MQAQAGPLIRARRRAIDLRERLKEPGLVFGPDSDAGVGNRDFSKGIPVVMSHMQFNADGPLLGKFDGIIRQVDQYLSK